MSSVGKGGRDQKTKSLKVLKKSKKNSSQKAKTKTKSPKEKIHFRFKEVMQKTLKKIIPQPKLSLYDWTKKFRRLSSESSASTVYSFTKTPYMKGIMDAITDPEVEEITLMSGAQIGKSELGNNFLAWMIDQDPCPILLLLPTLSLAQSYSKQRIAPMIRDNDRILEKFYAFGKKRTLGDSVLEKSFIGGSLTLVGSNSPAQLCSRPIRIVIIDEIDRMETTSEGDPVALAVKRTATFENKRKILYLSTPSRAYVSRIERLYNAGSMSKFYVPCHLCGHKQVLVFKQIKFLIKDDNLVDGSAHYECESCRGHWNDIEKQRNCCNGEWVDTAESASKTKKSFWVNEYYSGFRKMDSIARDFLTAKNREDTLMVFTNTSEGLPFESKVTKIDYETLYYNRREVYDDMTFDDKDVICLTAGVDVQKDRLVYEVVAWGRNFESWSLCYRHLLGDTQSEQVWYQLEKEMEETFEINGVSREIEKIAVDTGFQSHQVRKLIRRIHDQRYMPIVGRPNLEHVVQHPSLNDTHHGKVDKRGFRAYNVGVDRLKEEFYAFLIQESREIEMEDGEIVKAVPQGLCHFPIDYTIEYFKELTAEVQKVKTVQGQKKYSWEIIDSRRNEALDCRIYARAAAYFLGYDRKTLSLKKPIVKKNRRAANMWSAHEIEL